MKARKLWVLAFTLLAVLAVAAFSAVRSLLSQGESTMRQLS